MRKAIMFFFFLGARELYESPELDRFQRALEMIQLRAPTITVQMLATLLRVGNLPTKPGDLITVSDIVAQSPGQSYSTIARQLDLLGDGMGKTAGLGLIEKRSDAKDRRIRHVAISEKGKLFLYELDSILAPDLVERSHQAKLPIEADGVT